jgi:hypothetical protein
MPTLGQRLAREDARRFVGRERELGLLEAMLVDDPPASVAFVHGEGGIGKSALLRELARRAARHGRRARLIEGRDLDPVPGALEHALAGAEEDSQPLLLFDTWERMAAADGFLRGRVLPRLPERTVAVIASRTAPAAEWFQEGWEQVVLELALKPLPLPDAKALVAERGVADRRLADHVVHWAGGSPLALTLGADAARVDPELDPAGIERDPDLVRALLRRLDRAELDPAHQDVVAVAALARVVDARLLAAVLPGVDAAAGEAWLRGLTFAEPLGAGITLHELVRRAIRSDLRARTPQREAELRTRLADHLHARATAGESRLLVDLAELVEDPHVRWGFGADGSVDFRVDTVRDEDEPLVRAALADVFGSDEYWEGMAPFFAHAPQHVTVARDVRETPAGVCIAATPHTASAVAEADAVLGPRLAHARERAAHGGAVVWRDSLNLAAFGDPASPVLAILNTAAILRNDVGSLRYSYLPIDPTNPLAVRFAEGVGAQREPALDAHAGGRVIECHVLDHGPGGVIGLVRAQVHREAGVAAAAPASEHATADDVREALRRAHQPPALAASPLARGTEPGERAASVRALLDRAVVEAFGPGPDEELLRQVLRRGYLDEDANHERAMREVHVSRATYFRRLREASDRVAEWVVRPT